MSDSTGAFINALDPTKGLSSPFDMYNKVLQAKTSALDLQAKQGQQLWGQALQQATDPATGVVDYDKANRIAATMGPAAATAAPKNLANTSNIKTQQIQQTGALYNLIGSASASLMKDPSDANIENIRGSLISAGAPAGALTELDRIKSLPVAQRPDEAYKHNLSAMDAQYKLAVGGYPTPVQIQMPQGAVTTVTQPPSPYAPASTTQVGGVGATMSPDVAGQKATWTDSRGNPQQGTLGDYNVALGRKDVAGPAYDTSGKPITLPGTNTGTGTGPTSTTPNAPPAPPVGAQIRSPGAYTPRGATPAQPPATTATTPPASSVVTPSPAASTPPPASTTPPAAAPNAARGLPVAGNPGQFTYPNGKVGAAPDANGGVRYADGSYGTPSGGFRAPAAPAPAPAPTSAQPPASVPPVATAPAGSGAVVGPTGARSIPGPAPGTVQEQEASATQYAADRADAGNFQSRIWPIVQARAILQGNPDLKTGQGAQAVNTIKSGLQTLTSIFTPADIQSIGQAQFDELGKYFQQAVNANPFSAGSDQRLAAAVSGNPSAHLSTLANKDILTSMIGLERMKQAAFTDFQNSGQPAANWGNFKSTWQTQHDPRAFVVDMMSDPDRQKMFTAMSPSERTAFQNTLNLIKANPSVMNTAPMPQKQSFVAPPSAQPNALAMAQPQAQQNALLMTG